MSAVIKIENLTKIYKLSKRREVTGLLNFNLEVEEGEIFGLLGPNGSGKTTLLKIMLGLISPTKGKVEILGKRMDNVEVKKDIGFLPENPYYYEYLTGSELLDFYGDIFDLPENVKRRRSQELLSTVGLAKVKHMVLRNYSKGMLERIGLACALLNNPKLLILDEPTTGLDPIGGRETRDLLLGLKKEGKTILLSSHFLSEVERICDRIGILDQGRLLAVGRLKELLKERKVETFEDLFIKIVKNNV
ncbi:MAG: ABC transporter ATP-binding protein [Candidatus Omnitrophica bacterium]|nr:ABC transporter ATP-binding protein [Candidatus Omnitrophota bacterium]